MKTETKVSLLQKQLRTKELVANLPKLTDDLEKMLIAEADFRSVQHSYLASRESDCGEVKRLLAELSAANPGKNTIERDAWITRQRVDNKELNQAILKQREVAFLIEDHRIAVEIAKKKLENTKTVIALRTAQINFLSEG